MNIVYMIGNGFDLNLGLKTSYKNFLENYLLRKNNIEIVDKLKRLIKQNIQLWSDFELSLGTNLNKLEQFNTNEIIQLFDDLQDSLADYLSNEALKFKPKESMIEKIKFDIIEPEKYLNASERQKFLNYRKSINTSDNVISIISFNYTDTIEALLEWESRPLLYYINDTRVKEQFMINEIIHIHGTIDNNMLIGVDNELQINSNKFKNDKKVIRSIIKPLMNLDAGTLRDNQCLNLIKKADLIVIFGMSFGLTDKTWWRQLIKACKVSNARIIIFNISEQISRRRYFRYENTKEEIKEQLLKFGNLTSQEKEIMLDKIFVSINSNMFKLQ